MVKVFFSFLFSMSFLCDFAYSNDFARARKGLGSDCNIESIGLDYRGNHYTVCASCKNKKEKNAYISTCRGDIADYDLESLCNIDGKIKRPGEKGCR